jgi:hypothetical protein
MPLPNFGHLQAQPSLLLNWLNTNLLMAANAGLIANVLNPPGTALMTIAAALAHPAHGALQASDTGGIPMGVYDITNAGVNAGNGLPSYICNYNAGGVNSVMLGSLGDYCFTVNLNGCTFGIGTAGAGGARRVAHANRGGNTILQRGQIQGAFAAGANLAGLTLLEPAQYRRLSPVLSMQATVFGIREGTNWRFYFQCYSNSGGGQYRVYGVFPIVT